MKFAVFTFLSFLGVGGFLLYWYKFRDTGPQWKKLPAISGHPIRTGYGVNLTGAAMQEVKDAIKVIDKVTNSQGHGVLDYGVDIVPPERVYEGEGVPKGRRAAGTVVLVKGRPTARVMEESVGVFLIHEVCIHVFSRKTLGHWDSKHASRSARQLKDRAVNMFIVR